SDAQLAGRIAMAVIGDVLVKLVADFAEFAKGMDDSTKRLEGFGKTAVETGQRIEKIAEQAKAAAEALGVMWAVHKVLEVGEAIETTASNINTLAKNLELTTDQVQALEAAARHAGVGQDQMTSSVARFNQVIGEAVLHNSNAIDFFDKLGVKILDAGRQVR